MKKTLKIKAQREKNEKDERKRRQLYQEQGKTALCFYVSLGEKNIKNVEWGGGGGLDYRNAQYTAKLQLN